MMIDRAQLSRAELVQKAREQHEVNCLELKRLKSSGLGSGSRAKELRKQNQKLVAFLKSSNEDDENGE